MRDRDAGRGRQRRPARDRASSRSTTPVSGDADRLQQIVWNLLSNAIKFTPRGGKVQLRLSRVNSHVEVTVSDTGRGICAGFPAVRLRAVPSGGRDLLAGAWRSRPRAGDRQAAGRTARRHDLGDERRTGHRRDLHADAAADDRSSTARAAERASRAPRTDRGDLTQRAAARWHSRAGRRRRAGLAANCCARCWKVRVRRVRLARFWTGGAGCDLLGRAATCSWPTSACRRWTVFS